MPRRNRRKAGKKRKFSRNKPWYTAPRWRSTVADRDNVFWVCWGDEKKEERLVRASPPVAVEDQGDQPMLPEAEVKKHLHVVRVDLHIEENAKQHHTDRYECNKERTRDGKKIPAELVIRRGQPFKMTIYFDRPYNIKENDIKLMFNLGDEFKPNTAMSGKCKVDETKGKTEHNPKKWSAKLVETVGNSLKVEVFVPGNVPIGEWSFCVQTIVDVKNGKDIFRNYEHNEEINIICNPWCKEDQVYMEDEDWRKEAVLNDQGVQYTGNKNRIYTKEWTFGQFEDGVLEACFAIIRKCFDFLEDRQMGNAVTLVRYISQITTALLLKAVFAKIDRKGIKTVVDYDSCIAKIDLKTGPMQNNFSDKMIVNSCDDDGVLTGNWSGDYEGGVSPSTWASSVQIVKQFVATGKPIEYGQCWVFSAVTTTVCRAVGIPCRSVTNFASAHNTDKMNLNIDTKKYKNLETEEIVDIPTGDSVWNFHVWNEVWMRRPDLCKKGTYNGWQVIDATPQELSGKYFCCGPAPVKAIKEGQIDVGDDTSFVFSEVAAHQCEWMWNEEECMMVLKKRRQGNCGKNISTHFPTGKSYDGSKSANPSSDREAEGLERQDLTDMYKYAQDTPKGREIYKKASKKLKEMYGEDDDESEDDECTPEPFEITFDDVPDTYAGQPFEFNVHLKSKSDSVVDVQSVSMKVYYTTYFDSVLGVATTLKEKGFKLQKGQDKTFKIPMRGEVVEECPQGIYTLKVSATYKKSEREEDSVNEDYTYSQTTPEIKLKGPKACVYRQEGVVEVSFTNPLKKKLTGCTVHLYGNFYWKDPTTDTFEIPGIAAGQTWKKSIRFEPTFFPYHDETRKVKVVLDTKELADISGSLKMAFNFA